MWYKNILVRFLKHPEDIKLAKKTVRTINFKTFALNNKFLNIFLILKRRILIRWLNRKIS